MKTKISMLIAATVMLVSCDIDKQPLSQLSPDNFFSNETELQAFSNQFYTIFPSTSVYEEESDMLIKDGLTNGQGRALGEGTAPVAAVREYAIAHGLEMVVESETLNPTGIKEVERCIKYLRSLEA